MDRLSDQELGPNAPTAALIREAVTDAQALIKLEVRLARNEVRDELVGLRSAAIAFGVAAVLALLGVALLLVALVLAISPIVGAVVAGASLLGVAVIFAVVGAYIAPKKPLDRTRRRLTEDVKELKEHVA